MGNAAAMYYLWLRDAHERFLDLLADVGVLTRVQADAVTYFQLLPDLMPCQMVMDEGTWEAVAGWQQRPHRELDPRTPEHHEAVAEHFMIYYGRDDETVARVLAVAERLRLQPGVDPDRDEVGLEGGRRREPENVETGSGSVELLEPDGHREDAAAVRRVRELARG